MDLEKKLNVIRTKDILLHSEYVLSLIIPCDQKEKWNNAVHNASMLRKIHQDYRFSLLKYKNIFNETYRKRYSYVCIL